MNENEEMLEEELTETVGEDAEEVESEETAEDAEETEPEEEESEESEDDFDFEYDDEGNIVIPEEDDPEEEDASADGPSGTPVPTKGEGLTSSEQDVEAPSPTKGEGLDPKDAEIARLRRELEDFKSQSSDTLKKMGGKGENPLEEMAKMAAEAEGLSLAEYQQKRERARLEAEARAVIQNQRFEQIAAADLAELHAAYPETREYKHVKELPDEVKRKFGEFRDKGLTAKQAYAAANPDGVRATVATAVKKQAQHDSKAHLKSSVPKSSKDTGVKMTRSELREYREMFPGLSDKEINDLYKKANR